MDDGDRIAEKERFDLICTRANGMSKEALHAYIRLLLRPAQAERIAICGDQKNPPVGTSLGDLFYEGIPIGLASSIPIQQDHDLHLARDIVLPGPWDWDGRFRGALSTIGSQCGSPWKQDGNNHDVVLYMPWRIGVVANGHHSIATGIINGDGVLTPWEVHDGTPILDSVRTDGLDWYESGRRITHVTSGRHAAVFELGRRL